MRIVIERMSVPSLREKLESAGFEIRESVKLYCGGYEVGAMRPPVGLGQMSIEIETGWVPPSVLVAFIQSIAKY